MKTTKTTKKPSKYVRHLECVVCDTDWHTKRKSDFCDAVGGMLRVECPGCGLILAVDPPR